MFRYYSMIFSSEVTPWWNSTRNQKKEYFRCSRPIQNGTSHSSHRYRRGICFPLQLCCLIWALSKTLHPRFDTCVVCGFVMRHVAGFIMDGTHTMMSVWALTSHDTHDTNTARRVLTSSRVRHVMLWRNQIHSVNLWTLGIPKMYMGTLGYNIQISL